MDLKQQAAEYALNFVQDGMLLGLGSGSTATCFLNLLGERLKSGTLRGIRGVPTSSSSAERAKAASIPLITLVETAGPAGLPSLDLAVDGADEIDPHLGLIKGLGRAMLREKVIEIHARRFIVIAEETKLVPRLGRGPLPVEILPFEAEVIVRWLRTISSRAELWLNADGSPVVTDNGNYLARCWFTEGISDPSALARTLADRPGVLEHGLFLSMASLAVIASPGGIQIMERE
ncbi:MAG TPA: ribose-5-phosphate isomerase RpiA [Anaerolineales bacterium]|nr:ribose-5-phosphate isomerase RpiA [Anaerolineales bacterium]